MFLFGVIVGFVGCLYWQGASPIETIVEQVISEADSETSAVEKSETPSSNVNYKLERSIPLRDLPLSDSQKKTAATFGINVETFIITPAMLACAEVKLGTSRLEAIIAGQSPTFTESFSLMGCLSAK